MFKHILCPTDLGSRDYTGLKFAVEFAHQYGAKITLLNIHKEFLSDKEMKMLRVSVSKMKEKIKQIAISAKEEMKTEVRKLQGDDIDIDYQLHEGKPENEIVKYSNNSDVDLIVMCTDGRDSLMNLVKGTISEHVINKAKCPVLVIPFK